MQIHHIQANSCLKIHSAFQNVASHSQYGSKFNIYDCIFLYMTQMQLIQGSIPVGCVSSAAVTVGGACLRRWGGGVSARGCVCPGGVSIQGVVCLGGCLPKCMLRYTPSSCGQNS